MPMGLAKMESLLFALIRGEREREARELFNKEKKIKTKPLARNSTKSPHLTEREDRDAAPVLFLYGEDGKLDKKTNPKLLGRGKGKKSEKKEKKTEH